MRKPSLNAASWRFENISIHFVTAVLIFLIDGLYTTYKQQSANTMSWLRPEWHLLTQVLGGEGGSKSGPGFELLVFNLGERLE